MLEYSPRAILANSETGTVSVVAPNGVVTVPGPVNIPEFRSIAAMVGAIGMMYVIIAIRSDLKRKKNRRI